MRIVKLGVVMCLSPTNLQFISILGVEMRVMGRFWWSTLRVDRERERFFMD